VTETFDVDWLTLREPFDRAARSVRLAQRLVEHLPVRPHLIDLGAGTGSMFRFLAPLIARGQDWTLVDADAQLLDDAFGRSAAWARRQGFGATMPDDALLVRTPRGLWRMQALTLDLAASPLPSADAVLCSALLDLVSPAWLERLLDRLKVPLLACLTVDGRTTWRPRHPADAIVRAAFRRDQHRDKGFGRALGASAPSVALRALAARGFTVTSAPSDWHVPPAALRMQRALVESTAAAAHTAAPAHHAAITAWAAARLRQAMQARLAITVGHRDILALPPGG
jgi:hypothetical protein